jgi:hypothetical protein
MNLAKPNSCPKSFLDRFSAPKEAEHQAESSDFFAGQD